MNCGMQPGMLVSAPWAIGIVVSLDSNDSVTVTYTVKGDDGELFTAYWSKAFFGPSCLWEIVSQ